MGEASTAVTMKVFMVLALAAGQINSQDHGNMDGMSGSGHGGMDGSGIGSGMDGSGMGSGMGGSGSGMGGSGYGMGGSGMGGSGYGMGMGSGMGMGYGGMGMDMDNMQWPERCRRHCIYKKRDSWDDRMYCFARSEYSQSMCM